MDDIAPAVPDLSPEEFKAGLQSTPRGVRLKDVESTQPQSTSGPVSTNLGDMLLPVSEAEIQRQTQKYQESRQHLEPDTETQVELGRVPGVPFKEGIDTWTYLQYKMKENEEAQVRYLGRIFGPENVRINEKGKPVVRVKNPQTGEIEDHTADPWDMNAQSIAAFAASEGPALAATALALRGGNPEGIAGKIGKIPGLGKLYGAGENWLFKSILGASTYEAVKAVQGAGEQSFDRPVVDLPEIFGREALQHAVQVPLDVAFDAGALGAGKTVQWAWRLVNGQPVATPVEGGKRLTQWLMSKGAKETEQSKIGKAAMEFWENKGQPYKATIGELTDLPIVATTEAYLGREVAGSARVAQKEAERQESARAIQRFMLGPGTLPLDEEVGRRGIAALGEAYKAADATITGLQQSEADKAAKSVQARLLDYFGLNTLPERGYPWPETGDFLRSVGTKARDVWKEVVGKKYSAVTDHPLAAVRNISGDDLAQFAARTKSEMISAEKEVEKIGYDSNGSPIDLTTMERAPLKSFDISGVIPMLDDLQKLKGQTVSILDLKSARTATNEAINKSLALTDTRNHFLTDIADFLDGKLQRSIDDIATTEKQAIQKASAGGPIPTGGGNSDTLRTLWDDAVGSYKEGVARFKDRQIASLWSHPEERVVDTGSLVNSLQNSTSRYKAMVNFFGEGSEAVNGFRDTVKKRIFSDSLADSGGTVDASKLLQKVKGLAESNPQLYKDVLGDQFEGLAHDVKLHGALTGKLDYGDLLELMKTTPTPSRDDIMRLVQMEQARGELFNNAVVKKFVRGELEPGSLNPESFVRFLGDSNLKDVQEVMHILENKDPDIALQIKRKTLQDIFRKASREATSLDTAASIRGDPSFLLAPGGLKKVLGTDQQRAVYQAILGPDKYEELIQTAALQVLEQQKLERAKGTGMLVSGQSTGSFIKALLNPMARASGTLTEWAKIKALSVLITTETGNKALASVGKPMAPPIITPPMGQGPTAALLTSAQFAKGLAEEFTDPYVRFQVASTLKRMAGISSEPEESQPESMEEFLKGIDPNKQVAQPR